MAGSAPSEVWQIGEWVADASDDSIARAGETIKLEPRTMRLLICLAESGGAVVSQEQLLNDVWAGVVVGPASVYQSVSQLRKLLRDTDSPPTYIVTVARKGYRLIAHAQRLERRAPARRPELSAAAPAPALPTAPTPPPIPPAYLPDRKRNRYVVAAALALVVALLLALSWVPFRNYLARAPSTPSIVVLPFVDMSADKSEQPFCDGLTEELSSWLAQLPTLRVVARTSAFAFKDKPTDVREIGRQLGTTYVLEGSMRRTGNYMRVSVQLIDARTGYHRWAGSYDAPVSDVIKVQEDISRSIATNLEIRLAKLTTEDFAARGSISAEAYQLYLAARYHWGLLSRAENERAIEMFKQAIALDGNFAPAYVGLASAYLNQQTLERRPIGAIAADVQPLLQRAAQLRPNLAELYAVRGTLAMQLMRPDDALRDLQRAVALNPNSRDAYSRLGSLHLVSGQPRAALEDYTSATALDPLDDYLHAQRCLALQDLARFEEANSECAAARALAPDSRWAYSASSWLADAQGRIDEALHWNDEAMNHSPADADLYAERGKWQLTLGMAQAARATYQRAMEALAGDAEALDSLTELGLLSALAADGPKALKARLATTNLASASTRTLLDVANAQLLAGDAGSARVLVDRALARSDYDAEVTRNAAWDARQGYSYPLIAAYTYLNTGSAAAGTSLLQKTAALLDHMTAGGTERHGVYVLRADVAALRGDADGALRALTRASQLGWRNVWAAEHEPFLETLRGRSDYQTLIKRISAANQSVSSRVAAAAVAAPVVSPGRPR